MLIQFTIENYKSFRDKQSLSFVSSQGDEYPEHVVELDNGLRINKVAAIIGGNGTGKSQLLAAITEFAIAIRQDRLDELHKPHIFSEESRERPTFYEVIIVNEEKILFLRYGISVFNGKVISEYLYSRPVKKGAKESCIFKRELSNVEFIKQEYKKQESLINPILKDSGAVITFSKSLRLVELNDVIFWAMAQLPYIPEDHTNQAIQFIEEQLHKEYEQGEKNKVEEFLVEYNKYIKLCPIYIDSVSFQPQGDEGKCRFVYRINNHHDSSKFVSVGLDRRSSFFSRGTLNILGFMAVLLWSHSNKFTLYIDEIDSSIHHLLANSILKKVIHDVCQLDNVQFVFSTHNLSLLDDCIRRDELNIIYKNEDKSSEIINASKFSVRKDAKISAKYFRGEFGSLPTFLDDNLKG
ncbi:AAA family ATPase [Providencia sp. PROV196]|uniref:AAA family ATPase n=1 Tax=Providencia sp. PROV196 TaxID=2949897 RepID=UPI0023494228|nr:AAA family ATPase [Providencia sp. PROV196]